ncbi:DUF945 family protein [Photobacterium atrarenae]|uniref:YdgA family protein n=1 Tax=Photobacterium atrarenae TaxID=865757 RepID=A0ABY5GEG1_9GAMM|nr:DUF945 family protein [Photobacterium atrarenae]UTV26773.1 YdgA family protein [Photobacterium atrarenae]
MLKKIGAIGGAVSIILCWPLATGQIGERIYLDTVGQYENPYLTISNESYDRGYLSSDVVSRLEVKDDWKSLFDEEGLPTVWYVRHQVKHGVLGLESTSELVLDEAFKPVADKLWGEGVTPIRFTTSTALTRTTEFSITMNPIAFQDEQGANADVTSFVMTGTVDSQGSGEFHYQLPEANLTTTAREAMTLTGLEGSGQGVMDGQFWIGSQSLKVDHISFHNIEADQGVALDNLMVAMTNRLVQPEPAEGETEVNSMLTNTNSVRVDRVVALDGQEYQNFNFQVALSDMDYPAISRLGEVAEGIEQEMTQAQAEEAALALDLLVAKGLKFAVEQLSVETPKGAVTSHLNLEVAPGIARASQNLASITEKLQGDFSLQLPIALVEANPAMLEKATMMEQNGIVEKGAEYYRLNMKVDGDQIILASGDQLPLAMLMMLFM